MKRILLSMTLLIASSGIALASNPFQTMERESHISQPQRFVNQHRTVYQEQNNNNVGIRAIRTNYTPRQPIQTHRRVQKRVQRQPIIEHVPRHVQPRVQPQHSIQQAPRHVRPQQFNPNSKFAQAQRAAKRGNPNAEFDLAMMYAKGEGVNKDPRVAFNLFHRAARKGHVAAKYCMGVNFEKGLGVIPQHELARHWYGIAAKAGHQQAQQKLAQLSQNSNQSLFRNARYSRR
ncbi:MAG: sel1 repeat family protein [Sulfurovaceae bacterium]|nr:sel1 repeat family protein [Sulfurovaceae bacterium]